MEQTYIDKFDSVWLKALTLGERAVELCSISQEAIPNDFGHKRLERWRSKLPFATDFLFTQWLQAHQLSVDQLLLLLGEPTDSLRKRHPNKSDWLMQLEQAFSHPDFITSTADSVSGLYNKQNDHRKGILDIVEPLIRQSLKRFRKGVLLQQQSSSNLPFDTEKIERLMMPNLTSVLVEKLLRTMVLEVNVARLQGVLKGDTSEARFQHFVERLHNSDVALKIMQEYPVLARLLVITVNQWVNFSLEFLIHLGADWKAIHSTFTPESDLGCLSQISAGVGDVHREGRSVTISHFTSGFKLVYKPHSLKVDTHFAELLNWLNQRGNHSPFWVPKVLDRGNHGWMEFIENHGCTSQEEVKRFYKRIGEYVALLYVLEATDFHYENLIASGEHPVLVE